MTRSNRKPETEKKRGVAGLWRRALIILVGLILGLNLYHWNASALAGNALPMPFGTGAAVVLSGSMSPALEVNDLVFVQKKESYDTGDIIVYQSGYDLIVHRIIAQEENQITTQGDANNVPDAPISVTEVKGAVVAHIPFLGAVFNILKLPAVSLLILIGACILLEKSFQAEKRVEEENLDVVKEEIRRLRAELDSEEKENTDGKAG